MKENPNWNKYIQEEFEGKDPKTFPTLTDLAKDINSFSRRELTSNSMMRVFWDLERGITKSAYAFFGGFYGFMFGMPSALVMSGSTSTAEAGLIISGWVLSLGLGVDWWANQQGRPSLFFN